MTLCLLKNKTKQQKNKSCLWFAFPDGLCMWQSQLLNSIFLFISKCLIPLGPELMRCLWKSLGSQIATNTRGLGLWREGGVGEKLWTFQHRLGSKDCGLLGWLLAGKSCQRRERVHRARRVFLILPFPVLGLNSIWGSPLSRFLQWLWWVFPGPCCQLPLVPTP